jgi:putative addiction module component (TIGR02574 family)
VSVTLDPASIEQLTVEERLELIGILWDSVHFSGSAVQVPDWHLEVVERRLAAADADPGAAIPWEEVKASLGPGS